MANVHRDPQCLASIRRNDRLNSKDLFWVLHKRVGRILTNLFDITTAQIGHHVHLMGHTQTSGNAGAPIARWHAFGMTKPAVASRANETEGLKALICRCSGLWDIETLPCSYEFTERH